MFKYRTLILYVGVLSPLFGVNAYANDKISFPNDLIVSMDTHHDVSVPLRDIKSTSDTQVTQSLSPIDMSGVKSSLVPLQGFQGIGKGLGSYVVLNAKPDIAASVGKTQYVQWADKNIAVFDKATGYLATGFPKAGNLIWSNFHGPCETSNRGMSTVKYDQLAKRWVLTQHAYQSTNGPFYLCLAVSTSEDATGSYYRYSYTLESRTDYARLGLWPDAYYMAFNMLGSYKGSLACALDRNKILLGRSASMQCKRLSSVQKNPMLPVDLDGTQLPKSGNPAYFLGLLPPSQLVLTKFYVNFADPDDTEVRTVNIPVTSYKPACTLSNGVGCVVQPNTSNMLTIMSDRLNNRFVYRQYATYGALVATHTVDGPGFNPAPAIRWYEFHLSRTDADCVPEIYQQATFAPNTMSRFLGSIALDKFNNIAIGYNITSSLISPSLEFATHRMTDVMNTLFNQPMMTGTGSQVNDEKSWGSDSAMSIDPDDDCTFWYTGEYLTQTGSLNWSTAIIKFKLGVC